MVRVAVVGNKGAGKSFLVRSLTNDSETKELAAKLPSGDEQVITFVESEDPQVASECDLALVCCDISNCGSLLLWEKRMKSVNQAIATWSVFTKADQYEERDHPTNFDFVFGSGNEKQKSELVDALSVFAVGEPTTDMFKDVLGKIGDCQVQEITPKFEIRCGRWLKELLMMFVRSKRFVSVLRFMEEMCKFSLGNACAFSQAGVDLILLSMLRFKKEIGTVEEALMRLYMRIVNVAATQESVKGFMSLMAPESSNCLYRTFPFYLACLNDMIKSEQGRPNSWIRMKSESIQIRSIQGSRLRKGFTVTAWVQIDEREQDEVNVFSLSDAKNYQVACSVNGKEIFVQSGQTKKRVDIPLEYGKWIFVAVSCSPNGLTVLVNGRKAVVVDVTLQVLDKEKVCVTFGGSSEDTVSADKCLLGPVGVYFLLDDEEVLQIGRAGPRGSVEEITALAYAETENRNGTVVVKNGVASVNAGIHYHQTFAQVFVEKMKIISLIPLFSILEAKYVDGEQVPSFIIPLISILAGLLLVCEGGQREFKEMKGVDMLSHLLRAATHCDLSFGVYLRWVSLFKLTTSIELKETLFDKVITNPEIWIHAEGDAQRQITRHWCRELLKKFPEMWSKHKSFQDILAALRIYYWYDADAEPNVIYRSRAKNIPVKDIRQHYLKILGELARNDGLT